jgi:hypothetical protein
VKTFVVGFGAAVDAAELDALARAGGTARADEPRYYQAESASDLHAALESVVTRALPCTYDFAPWGYGWWMSAYFGSEPVPRDKDHLDGWDYDHSTKQVTFYGDACHRLASGEVPEFTVVAEGCRDTLM